MATTASTTRRFSVTRVDHEVVIRELPPEENAAHYFDREAAWTRARRLAQPAKAAGTKRASKLTFVHPDGRTQALPTEKLFQNAPPSAQPTRSRTSGPKPASDAQRNFLNSLIAERVDPTIAEANGVIRQHVLDKGEALTSKEASDLITLLKGWPRAQEGDAPSPAEAPRQPRITLPDVPEGHYAVEHEGTLKFYEVDRPQEGRWAGYTFLKVLASDERHPVKALETKKTVLEIIAADPQAAAQRYGRELGQCGICNRTLTDEESRAFGIGPTCRGKMGW